MGLGPNVSVLSAFLGALFLQVTAQKTRGQNRLMNNIIQTAGTSATSTAFMCVVAAAFGYLNLNETVKVHVTITPWEMVTWLTCSGTVGVLFIVLFRRYFLDDAQMVFADGVAAVAIMYPLLIARYGLGGDGLVAPTGLKLANMAVLLSKGISAFPQGALTATAIAAFLGVVLTLLEARYKIRWLPSAAGLGFALIGGEALIAGLLLPALFYFGILGA